MNKPLGWILLAVGAWLFWRSRSTASGSNPSPGGGLGAGPGGGSLTIGQVGSNFIESNSLADAVKGLVDGIWSNGGQGYGGSLSIKTPDGTLSYRAPISERPLILNERTGRLLWDP